MMHIVMGNMIEESHCWADHRQRNSSAQARDTNRSELMYRPAEVELPHSFPEAHPSDKNYFMKRV
jgi:hypothetical protein